MKRIAFFMIGTVALAGCRGSVPTRNAALSSGDSAILLKGRLFLPSGEIRAGGIAVNLESDHKTYRLQLTPMETNLYLIDPGIYRLSPVRNALGILQKDLAIDFNGHRYRTPFPAGLLGHHPILIKPGKIVSLGVLEARLQLVPGRENSEVSVALVDDINTRRDLVQQTIKKVLDPNVPSGIRDNAVSWSLILDQTLIDLQEEKNDAPPPALNAQ